jgi:DNA-binding FadR family transcriptional regulator
MTRSRHEEIADVLTRDVLIGQYRIGERLPSERDLSTRFDASRGAVREAMKILEQLGIAQIQPGGARVAPLEEASLDVIGHLLALGDVPNRTGRTDPGCDQQPDPDRSGQRRQCRR